MNAIALAVVGIGIAEGIPNEPGVVKIDGVATTLTKYDLSLITSLYVKYEISAFTNDFHKNGFVFDSF